MGRRMKRINFIVIIFLTAAAHLGCNRNAERDKDEQRNEAKDIPVWMEYSSEPVTFDWYINFSWYSTPWGDNAVSRKITEETGVSVNFIAPVGNETEKLNSLISSDTLPDILTIGWWEESLETIIENDMIWALNELADEYDPYFYAVTDEDKRNWYTREDGNIYCYPNSSYSINDYEENDNFASNQVFLVRKDIYEAIGSPDMTTPEGFQDAIKKAVKQFPIVEGQPLIPIGCDEFTIHGNNSFDNYLMSFLAVPYEKGGKYYDRYTDKDYISWLKLFRQLNEEGYLSNDIFIDKRGQLEEKISQGRYFCMLYQRTDIAEQQTMLYTNHPDRIYMAVDGPKNSKGENPALPGTGINGWTVTMISKNCENPARALSFLSYLLSEHGQKIIYLGVEGVTYDMVDEIPVIRPEVQELLHTDRVEYDRLYGADNTYWMLQDNVLNAKWGVKQIPSLKQLEDWAKQYTIYTGQYDVLFPAGSQLSISYEKIRQEWGNILPKLLIAETEEEFDKIFENFTNYRISLGIDKILEDSTRQMQKSKAKLGPKD